MHVNNIVEKVDKLNGVTRTLAQWCEIMNVKYDTVKERINSLKWSDEDALFTPVGCKPYRGRN